ncbi:MAG: amino acid adenylation domain-containing protein, partial [Alphaproteobacteria bacterium]
LLEARGIRADALLGHSLGEFVAAVASGVMDEGDALRVVAARGRLMQAAPAGAMLSVRADAHALLPLLGAFPDLEIAAENAPRLTVVAGPDASIDALAGRLSELEIQSARLRTSHAFHTASMADAARSLEKVLADVRLSPPRIPIYSTLTGARLDPAEATDPEYWARQCRGAVRFAAAASTAAAELPEPPIFVECGPGRTLSAFLAQSVPAGARRAIVDTLPGHDRHDEAEDAERFLSSLGRLWSAGASVDLRACGPAGRRVPLPTYPFERVRCWVDPPEEAAERDTADVERLSDGSAPAAPDEGARPEAAPPESDGHAAAADPVRARLLAIIEAESGEGIEPDAWSTPFLDLGFDSLLLGQIATRIASELNVALTFRELVTRHSSVDALVTHLEAEIGRAAGMSSARPDPGGLGRADTAADGSSAARPSRPAFGSGTNSAGDRTPAPADDLVPLTQAQQEIWLADQLGAHASIAFNQTFAVHLKGAVDPEALRRAVNHVAARHDALRARFAASGKGFRVLPPHPVELPTEHFDDAPSAQAAVARILEAEARTPFDLVGGPVFRAHLVQDGPDRATLVLSCHHIVCDGASSATLIAETITAAAAFASGREPELPEARSFAAWARAEAERSHDADLAYWEAVLADPPSPTPLPLDRPRPVRRSFAGGTRRRRVPVGLAGRLAATARRQGTTMFALMTAAAGLLVSRLSGARDLVLGIPVGTAESAGAGPLVGHRVNLLPLRLGFDEAATVADCLDRVRDSVLGALDHQRTTLGEILRQREIPRTVDRLPLTTVQFNYQERRPLPRIPGVEARVELNAKAASNFDLFLNALGDDEGIEIWADFNAEVLDPETIDRWLGHFCTLLEGLADADPAAPLTSVPTLAPDEARRLARRWNDTDVPEVPPRTLDRLVLDQAARSPTKVAVEAGNETLDYATLARRASALAGTLSARIGPAPQPIGVAMSRSVDLPVALLAVLMTGNSYVPLDPAHPPARLEAILKAAGSRHVICDDPELSARLAAAGAVPIAPGAAEATPPPGSAARADAPAYVIFTSGSTGTPKGVVIPHRAVVNFLRAMQKTPGFGPDDAILSVTTVSFDIAVLEIFLPLVTGGKCVLADKHDVLDGRRLIRRVARGDITVMQATPTLWGLLVEARFTPPPGLRILCGGEPMPRDLARSLMSSGAELWNMYGPTETTIWSSVARVEPGDGPIPVGYPIDNTRLHVLDDRDRLAPIGVVGELNIGGAGLALGYLGRDDLTRAAFREVEIAGERERLYRTGDLARRRPDGSIEVLGRRDSQVKLRGFRIELGEVETALRAVPGVEHAAAAVKPSSRGDQLVAYVVARKGAALPAEADMAAALAERLPQYMVPTRWVVLDALPRTLNGKLDRKRLPAPDDAAAMDPPARPEPGAPQGPAKALLPDAAALDERLLRLFAEVLGIPGLDPDRSLFALGVDSLAIFRLAARLIDEGLEVRARDIIAHPSVTELAAHLRASETRATGGEGHPAIPRLEDYLDGRMRGREARAS